jgi:oligo-1,6-glucosidase
MDRRNFVRAGLGLAATTHLGAVLPFSALAIPRTSGDATTNGYKRRWWKEAAFYEIYPRSFQDSNDDGIGDLRGIEQRLDYLKDLGVDAIWLGPHYDTANADNGYDIRDYRKVNPEFGTMEDFDRLLTGIKRRGMKLIIDLVVNHTSDEHFWFQQSRLGKNNPYRDFYLWRPGKNGGPPSNWPSYFGGSAWEKDGPDGEYYLHIFAKKQPDLNWDNPRVRAEVHSIMRFWLDKGVDGFRMDVIPFISKNPSFPDMTPDQIAHFDTVYGAGPHTHEYIREMNTEVLEHYGVVTVGEAAGITQRTMPLFIDERRQELDMIFQFEIVRIGRQQWRQHPWKLIDCKALWNTANSNAGPHAWSTVFLGNHDHPRMLNKFGDASPEHREASAKLLATLLLTQKGTPFLYQGDEIGMTNYPFASIDEFEDVEIKGTYASTVAAGVVPLETYLNMLKVTSRDNSRTPMQWGDAPHAGFTKGPKTWFPVNPNYTEINVAAQTRDAGSILSYYRSLARMRRTTPAWIYGGYKDLDPEHVAVFAYERSMAGQSYRIVLNMSGSQVDYTLPGGLAPGRYLFGNMEAPAPSGRMTPLRPWEARIYES